MFKLVMLIVVVGNFSSVNPQYQEFVIADGLTFTECSGLLEQVENKDIYMLPDNLAFSRAIFNCKRG